MPVGGKWFLAIVFLYRRNLRETSSWPLEGSRHTQKVLASHSIDHEYRHISVMKSLVKVSIMGGGLWWNVVVGVDYGFPYK